MEIATPGSTFPLIPQCNADARLRPSIISNFFLKTNFLDRSFLKNRSFERDSFIFRVFYDRSNSAQHFLKMYILSKIFTTHPRIPGTHFVRLPTCSLRTCQKRHCASFVTYVSNPVSIWFSIDPANHIGNHSITTPLRYQKKSPLRGYTA